MITIIIIIFFVIAGKFQTRISSPCHDDVGICRLQRGMFSFVGQKLIIKVAKRGRFLILVKSKVLKWPKEVGFLYWSKVNY